MRRIAPPDHKFKPYEGAVQFWREVADLLQAGGKLESTHFIRFYSFYADEHESIGFDLRPRNQEKEAVDYLYELMNSIHSWHLGETEKPQINWGDFHNYLRVLDRAVIDYGPKY